ncbi:hypothetical protein GCM10011316_23750 [Roseibium aquae]|uniref:Uncharacterized protein n=1 Tax=Roseibium aquae TaxID=1323746 RepID=A0A916TL18_9HYPH|nr:hypothetical protein [Roseibium aquae]GGB50928.1 hypothetical protein GCM10011316_23750 [Roseibium aquae]
MGDEITRAVIERGDLAHLALFLWALSATAIGAFLLRELSLSNRRFSDFVQELSALNQRLSGLRTRNDNRP